MRKVIQPIVASVAGAAVAFTLAAPSAAQKPQALKSTGALVETAAKPITAQSLQRLIDNRSQKPAQMRTPRFDLVVSQARWRQDVVLALRSNARATAPFEAPENARQSWF